MNETQLIQKNRELPSQFYQQLDLIVQNEKSTKTAFLKAVEIGKQYGFSDSEIGQAMKDYMKDFVPRSTLHGWTQPLLETVRTRTDRREESSSQLLETETSDIVDVTNPVEGDKTEYAPEPNVNKPSQGITHVKLSDAITVLLNARRDGVSAGNFFWESDRI